MFQKTSYRLARLACLIGALSACKHKNPEPASGTLSTTVESESGDVLLVYPDPANSNRIGVRKCAQFATFEGMPEGLSAQQQIAFQLDRCGADEDQASFTQVELVKRLLEAFRKFGATSKNASVVEAAAAVNQYDATVAASLEAKQRDLKQQIENAEDQLKRASRFAQGLELSEDDGLKRQISSLKVALEKLDADLKVTHAEVQVKGEAAFQKNLEKLESEVERLMQALADSATVTRLNPRLADGFAHKVMSDAVSPKDHFALIKGARFAAGRDYMEFSADKRVCHGVNGSNCSWFTPKWNDDGTFELSYQTWPRKYLFKIESQDLITGDEKQQYRRVVAPLSWEGAKGTTSGEALWREVADAEFFPVSAASPQKAIKFSKGVSQITVSTQLGDINLDAPQLDVVWTSPSTFQLKFLVANQWIVHSYRIESRSVITNLTTSTRFDRK